MKRTRLTSIPLAGACSAVSLRADERHHRRPRPRGFTLIELLVAITVIGILAALALGAMQKAQTRAKVIKTQTTIIKLHQQVLTKWESYKFRRLPVDPRLILGTASPQQANAVAFIGQLAANRNLGANDPLNVPPGSPGFPTSAQLSAVRLAAMRELQCYELPTGWSDIIATNGGSFQGSPGNWQIRPPQYLLTVPQLAQAYLQKINMAVNAAGQPPSQQQLQTYDAAECLYLIVRMACEEENNALADSMKEVGDADGDGLLEFQDAFTGMNQSFATNGATNNPIMWNRWPAGFCNLNRGSGGAFVDSLRVSDFQDDPVNLVEKAAGGTLQVVSNAQSMATFSQNNHDYFDPLRLDVPGNFGVPRGYQLTPLIYSAGVDSTFGLVPTGWNGATGSSPNIPFNNPINDPYAVDASNNHNAQWFNPSNGIPYQGVMDNITNHVLNVR